MSALGLSSGKGHSEGLAGVIGSGGAGRTWVDDGTWSIVTEKAVNTPTLGAELATGNLVVGTWYSITATEVNYFYTGCAVGNTFRATATTALDANNKVKPLTLDELMSTIAESTADVVAGLDLILTSGTQCGAVICLDSAATPANLIFIICNGISVIVWKNVAGTWTSVLTGAVTYGAGYSLRYDINDGALRVYYNSLLVGAVAINDAGVKDNVIHGMMSTFASNTIDNYRLWAKGTSGEHAALGVV